jgi:predicted metalloprotease with PDZ domain
MRPALRALVGLLPTLALGAALAQPACDVAYRVTPRHDTTPRALEIELSFVPVAGRGESFVRATEEWGGASDFAASMSGWRGLDAATRVEGADMPRRWRITHAPGSERVRIAYRVRAALPDPDDGTPQEQLHLYRTQIGADWFQFSGYSALVDVEHFGDNTAPRLCVEVLQPGAAATVPAFGSHLNARGPRTSFALTASPSKLRDAFYAGGTGWRVTERALPSGAVFGAVRGRFDALPDAVLADRVATIIDAQRRFWGDAQVAPQWVVLTPNFNEFSFGGTLVTNAALLHAGPSFNPDHDAFAFLIAHENLHQWIAARFGRVPEDARAAVAHYWFSEGFTNFYTHRLLLASGFWDRARYAATLTRVLRDYWRSPARNATAESIAPRFFSDRDAGQQMYSRGEFLAHRWDGALRAQGHAGLDALVQGLLLPAGAALDMAGPVATERVLDALQARLGAMPRRDVQTHVERGEDLALSATLFGPCFALSWDELPRWSLGFDRESFANGVARGVAPDGPAHRAGLRDGMKLTQWSVRRGDTTRDVELTVATADGTQAIRYPPVHGIERLPTLRVVRDDAPPDAACRAWIRATPRGG